MYGGKGKYLSRESRRRKRGTEQTPAGATARVRAETEAVGNLGKMSNGN